MLIDAVMWIIVAAIIAIIPCGCIMTRKKDGGPSSSAH